MGYFFIAAGLFSILGAVLEWSWFMNHRNLRFFASFLGRTGARIVYVLIGVLLVSLGGLMAVGVVAPR
ncbi:MAG: immunity 17 family protein [Planctomycetota bacterium]